MAGKAEELHSQSLERRRLLQMGLASMPMAMLWGQGWSAPEPDRWFPKLTSRSATVVVAAANSSRRSKAGADFVCDGEADQVQIQRAMASLPKAGGKLLLMEGNYTVDAPIIIDRTLTLEGMGAGWLPEWGAGTAPLTQISLAPGANANMMELSHPRNGSYDALYTIFLRHIFLYGNKGEQTALCHGIVVGKPGQVDGLWLEDVALSHVRGECLRLERVSNCWVSRCTFEYSDGIMVRLCSGGNWFAHQIFLDHCYLGDSLQGVRIDGNQVYNVKVYGGYMRSLAQEAIYIDSPAYDVEVSGVHVEAYGASPGDWSGIYIKDAADVRLMHNQIMGPHPTGGKYGIYVNGCRHILIEGNIIRDNRKGGVVLKGSSHCIVSGNSLRDNCLEADNALDEVFLSDDGIAFSQFNSIAHNVMQQGQEQRARYGVGENVPGDDYNLILGNIVHGAATGAIGLRGAHSQADHNLGVAP